VSVEDVLAAELNQALSLAVAKHLPGRHDQKLHGRWRRTTLSRPARRQIIREVQGNSADETLANAEKWLRSRLMAGETVEYGFDILPSGKIVHLAIGDEPVPGFGRVRMPKEKITARHFGTLHQIHNHPDSAGVISIPDVGIVAQTAKASMHVVGRDHTSRVTVDWKAPRVGDVSRQDRLLRAAEEAGEWMAESFVKDHRRANPGRRDPDWESPKMVQAWSDYQDKRMDALGSHWGQTLHKIPGVTYTRVEAPHMRQRTRVAAAAAVAVTKHLPGQHNQKRHNPHDNSPVNPAAYPTSDEDATLDELLYDPGVQAWHDHQTRIVERAQADNPRISGSDALKEAAFDSITADLLRRVDSDGNLRAWVEEREKAWASSPEQDRRTLYGRISGRLPPDSLANASDRELILRAHTVHTIDQWATSSHATRSDALQAVVADRYLGAGKGDQYLSTIPDLLRGQVTKDLAANRPFHEAYADAQYRQTQKLFAEAGVKEIVVARGMNWDQKDAPRWAQSLGFNPYQRVDFSPMSSWTTNGGIASEFAGRNPSGVGVVAVARVPAGRVLAMPGGGIGHANEQEIVLLGGPSAIRATGVTP
jgi:hypothetical protein